MYESYIHSGQGGDSRDRPRVSAVNGNGALPLAMEGMGNGIILQCCTLECQSRHDGLLCYTDSMGGHDSIGSGATPSRTYSTLLHVFHSPAMPHSKYHLGADFNLRTSRNWSMSSRLSKLSLPRLVFAKKGIKYRSAREIRSLDSRQLCSQIKIRIAQCCTAGCDAPGQWCS